MDLSKEIYRGGFYELVRGFEKAQRPYSDPLSYLPAVDCDLDALMAQTVTPPDVPVETFKKATIERKDLEFRDEFQGQSQLFYVHAMLIANLRRTSPPPECSTLYQRIWSEQGRWLGAQLPIRWRISAATTFADCGVTPNQRALGMGLSILFDMMKLYESERRKTGLDGAASIDTSLADESITLAFDMKPYALRRGDLDRNMLARLWALAEQDRVIFPLAKSMLFDLMSDPKTVFARLQAHKNTYREDDED